MGEKQHLPAHLPGLSPNQHHIHHIQNIHHIYQVCHPITLGSVVYEQTGAHTGAQPDDDGGVRSADGELQGRARRAAAEADKADILR